MTAARSHGRYEMVAEIARGGMGVVYRAHDRLAARDVAYKRLQLPEPRQRARTVALFQREYNALAQLKHPVIVDVYEYGFDDEGPFYTMELLKGQDLFALAPLPFQDVCRILRDLASALALLHARRLLHRDLSPGNVRVDADITKLMDFGALVPFGQVPDLVGTPAFMAPESLAGGSLDQRADLYALGALAYWGLTRKTAVRARTLADLPMAWEAPIVPPSHFVTLPAGLEQLVMSLLARDPLSRPASAAEVMERLSTIAELGPEPDEQKVALSYLVSPKLVGRDQPLARIAAALHSVDVRGESFLVAAEQGRGKSALLDDVSVRAQLAGATVLRADAATDTSPCGLARGLVRTLLALYPDLAEQAGRKEPQFRQLLQPRHLHAVDSAWTPVQASERQARTLALIQELVLHAAAIAPVVILVDQLQRIDAESCALLATLAAEAHTHRLLIVSAANPDGAIPEGYEKLKATSREVTLEPLDLEQLFELTATMFGGAANSQRLAQWLHERSNGNPARCMDLTRLLLQRQIIRYTAGSFTLPHDVDADIAYETSTALLGRVFGLGALPREIASVLSLQDMPMHVTHLALALDEEVADVVRALEELSARAVVSVADMRAALLSTSLRDALAATLDPAQRRSLHLASARAILADQGGDGGLRMQAGMHLLEAGAESEAVSLLTARGDGDFLSGTTPIPLLERVLDVLRRQGRSDEQCLGVLVPLVRGGYFGDLNAQRRHLDRTLKALANVCGVTLMAKLSPRLGPKLALVLGLLVAVFRHAFTPKEMRYGTFPETMGALLSILSASTAAFASAYESHKAFEIARMFEPLRAFGPDSAPSLSIEFCLATAEVGACHQGAARERYQKLLERFARPVEGMTDEIHLQFKQGILHGLAQAKVIDTDRDALRLADELEHAHMFFAPHAQTVRMGYHGYRGETELCDQYRRKGELLALRGGISWSSVTVLTIRSAYVCMEVGDVVGLTRECAEFERLATFAPQALLYRDAARGCIEVLRGRPERAIAIYEQLFASPGAEHMIVSFVDRSFYAKALSAIGRHADAKRACDRALADLHPLDTVYTRKFPLQQRALADAALGDVPGAIQQLDDLIERLAPYDNPLWSGSAHRDRAKVALLAHDQAGFDAHARAMARYYHATRTPLLIQQCATLQKTATSKARGVPSRDDVAIAFETGQDRLISVGEELDNFATESISEPPVA